MTFDQNKGRRVAISGTYSSGKTTTTQELAKLTRLPLAVARGMREILPFTFPGKKLEECTPNELVQLGLTRFGERCAHETKLSDGFVSDGSVLHEWAYGFGRQLEGANGIGSQIFGEDFDFAMRAFGDVVKRHARRAYTDVVHLPVEFPLAEDGHRPVSEAFRQKADEILLGTWRDLGFKVHIVTGSVEDRLAQIVNALNLNVSPTLEGPTDVGEGAVWYADVDDVLGPAEGRFFSNGFRNTQHDIYDLRIDRANNVATAKANLSYRGAWSKKNGEVCRPHLSSVDSILITGQMVQALMYTKDGISREESNNLWLRNLEVSPGRKPVEDVEGIPVITRVVKSCNPRMAGRYWHAADIECGIGDDGFEVKAKVAYELPERLQAKYAAARPRRRESVA